MPETLAGERLHRDVFPVEVYAPDVDPAPQGNCRVFVTSGRVIVWRTDAAGAPEKWIEAVILGDEVERDRGTLQGQVSAETGAGVVHVTKGRGCGCGSPLKALDPPVSW